VDSNELDIDPEAPSSPSDPKELQDSDPPLIAAQQLESDDQETASSIDVPNDGESTHTLQDDIKIVGFSFMKRKGTLDGTDDKK